MGFAPRHYKIAILSIIGRISNKTFVVSTFIRRWAIMCRWARLYALKRYSSFAHRTFSMCFHTEKGKGVSVSLILMFKFLHGVCRWFLAFAVGWSSGERRQKRTAAESDSEDSKRAETAVQSESSCRHVGVVTDHMTGEMWGVR